MAYDTLEPFGEERADLRNAMLGTALGNLWCEGTGFTLQDFMPFSDLPPVEQQSAALQIAKCQQIAALHNASVK